MFFSTRTNLLLSAIIVGLAFLAFAWIGLVIYALDGMDGKQDSTVVFHMLWITFLFGFVEYSILNGRSEITEKV